MTIVINGKEYEPTAEDRLWMLRAVQSEGAPQRAVAQTLVNGFAWAHARDASWTLTRWVRAYAQPVNPRWAATGDLFAKWLQGVYTKGIKPTATEAASAVRRRKEASSRTVFDRATHKAVERALNDGLLDVDRSATDYAAPSLDASRKGYKPLTEAEPGRNRFWTRDPAWGGYVVRAQAMAVSALPVVLAVVALVVVWRSA